MAQDQNLTEEKTIPAPPVSTDENEISAGDMETLASADENEASEVVPTSMEIENVQRTEEIQQPVS